MNEMNATKSFRKMIAALISALLLGVVPPVLMAAPAPAKNVKNVAGNKQKKQTQAATKNSTKKTTGKKAVDKKKKPIKKQSNPAQSSKSKSQKKAHKNVRKNRRAASADPRIGALPKTVQAATYTDRDESEIDRKKADDLLMSAMGLLGVSYRFGGSNPASGLDCSGFIQYIFREAMNVNLPRTAAAMSEVGLSVEKTDLKPGDLVFFSRGKRRVGHVGMYIGNGKFIHAPRTGSSIEIQNLDKAYYVKHYVGARRIPNAARAARFAQ